MSKDDPNDASPEQLARMNRQAQCELLARILAGPVARSTDAIGVTRCLLSAALDGSLSNAEFVADLNFGFDVPSAVIGVDAKILRPRDTLADKHEYDETGKKLLRMFRDNFRKFEGEVDQNTNAFARVRHDA